MDGKIKCRWLAAIFFMIAAVAMTTYSVALAENWSSPHKFSTLEASTLTWTGQGTTGGVLNSSLCDATNTPNGTENEQYLLWVLTTDSGDATATLGTTPELTLSGTGSGTYDWVSDAGNQFKFVTPYYTPDNLLGALAAFNVSEIGNGTWSLTISHGCEGPPQTVCITDADCGDDGDGNVCTTLSCVNSVCVSGPAPASTVCREAAGVCDLAEYCTGDSAACPADGPNLTTQCRAAAGVCDLAEFCSDASDDCPADGPNLTTQCRAAAGVCDLAEFCSDASDDCPADGPNLTTQCRAAAGVCDLAEFCSDASDDCPADGPNLTTQCRAAAGVCDLAEFCSDASDDCPADGPNLTTQCRAAAGVCDLAEFCSDASDDCPADGPNLTTQCRAAAGVCDLAEFCSDASDDCPADGPNLTTVCREATGVCDLAEYCSDASDACPADELQACSQVTNTELCPLSNYDYCATGSLGGDNFRLIYMQDGLGTSRLNASNSGQFYYNVFVPTGGPVDIEIPWPFVTNGAQPMQGHSLPVPPADGLCWNGGVVPAMVLCTFKDTLGNPWPLNAQDKPAITLGNYGPDAKLGDSLTVRASCDDTPTDLWVTIHLDYGLKGTTGWTDELPPTSTSDGKANDNANHPAFTGSFVTDGPVKLLDNIADGFQPYVFSNSAVVDINGDPIDESVDSCNEFKKSNGCAGNLTNSKGDPKAGVQVQLLSSNGAIVSTATSDADGIYVLPYKHTGKSANFTVKLLPSNLKKTVQLQANGFVIVNFDNVP